MFMARMFNTIRNICRFLAAFQMFVGRRPSNVPSPSLILFPVMTSQLNCGFAGLMTFNTNKKSAVMNGDAALEELWEKVKIFGLQNTVSGKIAVKEYLHGTKTLNSIEEIALTLKEEKNQEFLFFQTARSKKLSGLVEKMKLFLDQEEKTLEDNAANFVSADLEFINGRIIQFKDILWSLEKDILDNFAKIIDLSGVEQPDSLNSAAFKKYRQINLLLNSLNRLEVRGRDSAGLQIVFTLEKEKDIKSLLNGLKEKSLHDIYLKRSEEGDLLNGSIRVINNVCAGKKKTTVTFTYKTFSIVGELGRNAGDLKQTIKEDKIFQAFAQTDTKCETALLHTRWASVGSITEENCHPVNNYKPNQAPSSFPFYPAGAANINVILNGDIDNYPALYNTLELDREPIDAKVTTDTKIIPLQIEKYLKEGHNLTESFRLAVNDFEGSHAIAMTCDLEPGKFFLALKGSGQSIYVGVGSDQYMFSSELYGLVEVTTRFIKMNGDTIPSRENAAAGQIFILDQNSSGGLAGIKACGYDGAEIILKEDSMRKAEITTRDIDRGDYPHFFLKEISESAVSIRKTLRGKYRIATDNNSSPRVIFN